MEIQRMACEGCDARRELMKNMAVKAKDSWHALIARYSANSEKTPKEPEELVKNEPIPEPTQPDNGGSTTYPEPEDDESATDPESTYSDSDGTSEPTDSDPEQSEQPDPKSA